MNEETPKSTAPMSRIGKYEILEHIATGGMGIVYKARDLKLDRIVALKLLPADLAKQKNTLIRFDREAKAAAHLTHENIVAIYDVDEEAGTHFIAFEFIEGTDLQDYINRKCRLDPEEARQLMIQAARALEHAHAQGIVHRDIKPSNFLLLQKDHRMVIKLSDFGLAIRNDSSEEYRITRDNSTLGTVDYISPEQARDSRAADIRSDIYSLGCTYFHALAGVAPFARGSMPERLMHHLQSAPPDVRKYNKAVPEAIVAILQRMLAKKPEDRYQTPTELLNDLENPDNAIGDKRGLSIGKLDVAAQRRAKNELTQIVEKNESEIPPEEPQQVKTLRAKKASTDEAVTDAAPTEKPTPRAERKDKAKRQTESEAARRDRPQSAGIGAQAWLLGAGAAICLLVAVMVAAMLLGGRQSQNAKKAKDDQPPDNPPPALVEKPPQKAIETPKVVIDTSPRKMTVIGPDFPIIDRKPDRSERDAINKQYAGPFEAFPAMPKDARIVKVSRLASTSESVFRTLADALNDTKPGKVNVIEIHDDGPIHIKSLPALTKRTIWLRPGDGFRPLLVWNSPQRAIDAESPPNLFTLTDGKLIVERLDFTMQSSGDLSATIFRLPGTDAYLRDATFAIAGSSIRGVTLVRRDPPKEKPDDKRTQTWLQHCTIRGSDVVLFDFAESPGDVLVSDSFFAGYQHPVIRLRSRDGCAFGFRFIRSTVVTGHSWLRWAPSLGKRANPEIDVRLLDTILSRDDTTTAQGDLLQLGEAIDLSKISWQADNAVYAGWKNLLSSRLKTLSSLELDAWRSQWKLAAGDRSLAETWPTSPPPDIHLVPLDIFVPRPDPNGDPVAFAALTSPSAVGCVIGHLPPSPEHSLVRAFAAETMPIITQSEPNPPAIESPNDGLYHGEQLDLTKVDLGAHLTAMFKQDGFRPAPRIVMHLTGRGICQTSPLIAVNVPNLVLVFEPTKETKDVLVLEAKPKVLIQQSPMFEITGGNLELFGCRVRINPASTVPAIVQVQQGHLTLTRCHLEGPLTKAETFHYLIGMNTQGSIPGTLTLRDSYLVAAKTMLQLNNQTQLRARGNVFIALGDAIVFDQAAPTTKLVHALDHNTFALKHNLVVVKHKSSGKLDGDSSFFAHSNVFLAPFADDAEKPILLHGVEPFASRGRWHWQGWHNVYDGRLHAFFAGFEAKPAARQQLNDWRTAWGPTAEQASLSYDMNVTTKLIGLDVSTHPDMLRQLDRLVLPKTLRGDLTQAPPGADLFTVGILRKKG